MPYANIMPTPSMHARTRVYGITHHAHSALQGEETRGALASHLCGACLRREQAAGYSHNITVEYKAKNVKLDSLVYLLCCLDS